MIECAWVDLLQPLFFPLAMMVSTIPSTLVLREDVSWAKRIHASCVKNVRKWFIKLAHLSIKPNKPLCQIKFFFELHAISSRPHIYFLYFFRKKVWNKYIYLSHCSIRVLISCLESIWQLCTHLHLEMFPDVL